jgi:arabinogalactan endo-1,4-beta-galactosidase
MEVFIKRFDTYFILKFENHTAKFYYSDTTEQKAIETLKELYS